MRWVRRLWWIPPTLLAVGGGALLVWRTQSRFDWPTFFAALRDLASVLAIAVGAVWSYRLFLRGRHGHPHINLTHHVDQFPVDEYHRFVRVTTHLHNVGKVAATPPSMVVTLRQLVPLPESLTKHLTPEAPYEAVTTGLDLPVLGQYAHQLSGITFMLDPDEQVDLNTDFIIGAEAEVVEALSDLKAELPGSGWWVTTLHAFSGNDSRTHLGASPPEGA